MSLSKTTQLILSFILVFTISFLTHLPYSEASSDPVVKIQDSRLESIIRKEINKYTGNITKSDMEKLEKIHARAEINNLSGLEYAVNLIELDLPSNKISDISSLENLGKLEKLNLFYNEITDVSSLKKLTNLLELNLEGNQIKDISPLANLNHLEILNLQNNQIKELSALFKMNDLSRLNLSNNHITDISGLENISLNGNFGHGDFLYLERNFLDLGKGCSTMNGVEQMLSKNINIIYEPQNRIQVKINKDYLSMDVPPTIIDGRTLVPLRAIFEALGATMDWDASTRTVTGKKGNTIINLTIDLTHAKIDGKNVKLDVAAKVIDGRTMVPARFIAESLGKNVKWDANLNTVIISD